VYATARSLTANPAEQAFLDSQRAGSTGSTGGIRTGNR